MVVLLVDFVAGLAAPVWVILLIILFIYVLLGCVMDMAAITLITIPIILPLIRSLNFDIVWFGILYTILGEMGLITPPFGLNVFVISGMARDVPVYSIFKGVIPFLIAMIICLALVAIFPQIALFLPDLMLGN